MRRRYGRALRAALRVASGTVWRSAADRFFPLICRSTHALHRRPSVHATHPLAGLPIFYPLAGDYRTTTADRQPPENSWPNTHAHPRRRSLCAATAQSVRRCTPAKTYAVATADNPCPLFTRCLRLLYNTFHKCTHNNIIIFMCFNNNKKKNDYYFHYPPSLPFLLPSLCRSSGQFSYTFFTSPFISGRKPSLLPPPRLPGRFRVFASQSRNACARPVPVADCPGAA